MTQEDKELLLKDLSGRLPYGVNLEYTFKVTVIATNAEEIMTRTLFLYSINTLDDMTVSGIDNDGDETICFFEEVKPYLFPLSSMTEEQWKEIIDIQIKESLNSIDSDNDCMSNTLFSTRELKTLEWCYANHIDIHNLIPKGLAIDATGLNIY